MSKSLVIFDLDGTLLNTIADLGDACNYALRSLGYPEHARSTYHYMVGNGVRKLIERAQPDADEETVDRLLEIFKEYYNEHGRKNTVPYKGIPELLRTLTEKGVSLAIASNKYHEATVEIVKHYFPEIPFVAIMGQKEWVPTKPDPSIVFSILNEFPTPKAKVLYVGDSGVDIETARRACVESVGVAWGFRPVTELRNAYADHIVYAPDEILGLCERSF